MRAAALAIVAALALAGCAASPSGSSFIGTNLPAPSSQAVAVQVAAIVAHALPPDRTTVLIEPVSDSRSAIMPALTTDLRKWGFGIGNIKSPAPSDQPVTFYITPSGSSAFLLRVIVAGSIYTRLYGVSDTGALLPMSALTAGVFS